MIIRGNSGFGIELIDNHVIRKSAMGPLSRRLQVQIQKQRQFYERFQSDTIQTPNILAVALSNDAFHADMEYVRASDFEQFLSESGRRQLDRFLKLIIAYVRSNFERSRNEEVSARFRAKLAELHAKNVPRKYLDAAAALSDRDVVVPVGVCHGDLTLSNILFDEDRLILLDFLDSFVESPLQDIAKLRQDTAFAWSLLMYDLPLDSTKLIIALSYLDERINAAFAAETFYQRHYRLFQLVNLMRVLPYCKDPRALALLTQSLDKVLLTPDPQPPAPPSITPTTRAKTGNQQEFSI